MLSDRESMRRKNDLVLRKFGSDCLLVPLGSRVKERNGLFTLNGTAAFLWEMLGTECSFDDLTTAVVRQFDVDPSRARTDVRSFVEWMSKAGLLEPLP